MAPLGHPPVLLDIVEEHLDELEFLWEQREAGIFSADWTLMDLAEHEERAEAHLDGLRLSGLHGVELARERITAEEPSSSAAAAMVLHETREPLYLEVIQDALRSAEPPAAEGLRWGLRQFGPEGFVTALQEILESDETCRAGTAAHLLSFWRFPVPGLESLLSRDDPGTRILALGAAARLGELYPKAIASAVEAPDPEVRRAGLEAAARLGVSGLARHCRSAAIREVDPDAEAVRFLGILGEPGDVALLESLVHRPKMAPFAVAALGALGRVEGVPILLELMADEALGVPATLAYKRITGAGDVEGDAPFPPPEMPEGEDESEDLPPDPEKARADWEDRRGSMSPEVAWQMGLPVPHDQFPRDRETLTLEARRDLYFRLRARSVSGIPDIELEALAKRQMSGPPHGDRKGGT